MYKIANAIQDPSIIEQLKYIRKNIRYGDKRLISSELGLPYSTIESVLKGKYLGENGQLIIDFTVKMLAERIATSKKKAQEIKSSLKKLA